MPQEFLNNFIYQALVIGKSQVSFLLIFYSKKIIENFALRSGLKNDR